MKYTGPCCGYLTFNEPPGTYDIYPICFWEDDISQLRFPRLDGANHVSWIVGQKNFAEFGACEKGVLKFARKISGDDVKDKSRRPIDLSLDSVEDPQPGVDYGNTCPDDSTALYYWEHK